eukprot:GHRQ01023385.1.p1 GENE.GHRQ01023385.1~~GHRQ01023385.1.p1  ORF type:complete len:397 (+),score=118.56 GHRQ01023385.1:36-1226(+)
MQLEQKLSVAVVMERRLQSELADVQAARVEDQAEAAHKVSSLVLKQAQQCCDGAVRILHVVQMTLKCLTCCQVCLSCCSTAVQGVQEAHSAEATVVCLRVVQLQLSAAALAAAEAAATAARTAATQQQTQLAQLETRVAAAESESTSVRVQAAAKANELASMSGNVQHAGRELQRMAAAASDMVRMLDRMGGLQPQVVAALLSHLSTIIGSSRPSTAGTPSQPGTLEASGTTINDACNAVPVMADISGSQQLLDNMKCMQQQVQVLLAATQQLAEGSEYSKLLESSKEVSRIVDKLLHVEESLASNYTCLVCMKVFDHPVSAVPCGHNYCRGCYVGALGSKCRECSDAQAGSCIPAPALEQLCAKFDYRLMTLQGLQGLAQRHMHGTQATATHAGA